MLTKQKRTVKAAGTTFPRVLDLKQDCTGLTLIKAGLAQVSFTLTVPVPSHNAVLLGLSLLVVTLTSLPAAPNASVSFARWDPGQWEAARELNETRPRKWTQETDCIRAGEKEFGVLNLLHRSIDAADVTVESRMTFAGNGAPALILRAQLNKDVVGDAYSVVLYKSGVNVWRRVNGRSTKVAQAKFAPGEDKVHLVRATAEGWRLRVWVNEVLYVDAQDAAIPMAGRAGLWAGEGLCRFYSFTGDVKALPPTGLEPPSWQTASGHARNERPWSALSTTNGVRLTWGGNCTEKRIQAAAGAIGMTARSDANTGSHYNGLMIPLPARDLRGQQLLLDLRTTTPETTGAVYVRLYDAKGNRVASWNNWDSPLASGPVTIVLQPGMENGGFHWEQKDIQSQSLVISSIELISGTRKPNAVFDLFAANLRTAPPPPSLKDIKQAKSLFLPTPIVTDGRAVAVIVAPKRYQELGKSLQTRIRQLSGVMVPLLEDSRLADAQGRWQAAGLVRREESLILLGNLESNRLLPLLYARLYTFVDAVYPGPGGHALHTIHDPWGNGHNIVIVGGSDEDGVQAAGRALLELLATQPPGRQVTLPQLRQFKISSELLKRMRGLDRNPDEKAISGAVEKARAAFARGQHTGVTLDLYRAGFNYAWSGLDGYAELFKRLARAMHEIFRSKPTTYGGPWGMDADFNFMQVIAAWDWVEESPAFTDAERLEITRIIADYAAYWESYGNVRGARGAAIRHNHNTFPCLGELFAAEYFGKYYHVAEATRWLAAADGCFRPQALSFKPQEDANGYQWLTLGHLMRYSLARPDHTWFANGSAHRALALSIGTMDNLGYMSPFGDVGGFRGWGTELTLLADGARYFADPTYRWTVLRETFDQPEKRARIGEFETGMESREPAGFDGMRVFPIERRFHDYWTPKEKPDREPLWVAPVEQTYEKTSFRGGFDPMQPYLLLDGIGTGGHRHYDGNAFIRYTDRGRAWFADGDYIKALPKFHTSLLTFRDGQSSTLPPFCALEAQADLRSASLARSTVRNYGGADWSRNVVWLKDHCFVVIDCVQARTADDYSFRTVWHTLGEPALQGQRYTLKQGDERFVLDNLDGARLKLTDDESLGKNWRGYTNAQPVVHILQQIVSRQMKAGERYHFLNVFSASATGSEHPTKAERASDSTARVTAGGATMLVGVTDGKRTVVASGIETDALLFVLRPQGFALTGATTLKAGGRAIFHADAPVNVEFDATTKRALVDSPARLDIALPAGAVQINGKSVAARVENQLASFTVPPGRQDITLTGVPQPDLLSVPPPVAAKADLRVASAHVTPWKLLWRFPGTFTCLATADLDADGKSETLAGSSDGRVRCIGPDGQQRWEFKAPKAINAIWAGDLDHRGRGQVAFGSADGSLYLLDATGKKLWSHAFPYYKRNPGVTAVFPADLDGDGRQEIIAGTESWHFYALDREGHELWNYESVHGSTCGTAVDLTGDGKQEIIAGTEYYWWHAVKPDGQQRWSYSTQTGPHANVVAAGDLNGDGKAEVVFGGADGNLHALNADGKLLWQFNTGDEVTGVAVRDLNGDGKAEVIATSMSFNLYAIDGDGRKLWRRDRGDVLRDLAVVNVDGKPRIAVAGEDGRVALYQADGTLVREMKLDGPASRLAPADLIGTGRAEFVILNSGRGIVALGDPDHP